MTRIACLITMNEPAGNEPARPALLRVALAHSPRVEDAGAGRVYLDASGLEGLFGDEPRLAARLRDAAAAVGVEIRVGIAESRIAALAAARLGPGVMIVAPGGDAAYLAPAPLSLLDLPEETATRLSRWGLRTLGELAALPTAGLFERLAADGVEWSCRLGDGRVHEGALTPATPMTDAESVGGLLRLALEARPPRGVVLALTFRARPVRVAPAQESLTDRSRPAPRLLTATLNRLVALVGADAIGAPALLDTHRPDAIALATYHPHPSQELSPLRGEGEPICSSSCMPGVPSAFSRRPRCPKRWPSARRGSSSPPSRCWTRTVSTARPGSIAPATGSASRRWWAPRSRWPTAAGCRCWWKIARGTRTSAAC